MWVSFDVGAVVDALPDLGAQVVAGADGLARTVRRARLVDSAAQFRHAEPDDLVVSGAATVAEAVRSELGLLERLAATGVAALAVRLDPVVPLAPDLLDTAAGLGFPVISFPDVASSAEVTTAVLDALLVAQSGRLERFLDIHQRFAPIVRAAGGAGEIASTLHALIECPVAVLDADGAVLALVPDDSPFDRMASTNTGVRREVMAGEFGYGEVVAFASENGLDQDGLLALDRAASALAVRMAHASAVAAEQNRFAATSLEELIAGHQGSVGDVVERGISFGWDLQRRRAVLLASIDPPADPATLPAVLDTMAAAARATLGPDAIIWTRSTTIAALLAPKTDASSDRRLLAEALRHELDARVQQVTVSIGVGRSVEEPTDLPDSYREATRAVEVGRWAKGRHVTEVFDELGIERLLASSPVPDLAEFVDQAIGALMDHDRTHRTDLVESFATWLEIRNMAAAARRVHVHHNTFKNRLDRIEQILGPVLTDPARCLECEVAIYIMRHYEGPWRR